MCNIDIVDTNLGMSEQNRILTEFNSSVAMIKAGTWFHTHTKHVDINRKY